MGDVETVQAFTGLGDFSMDPDVNKTVCVY